MQNHSDYHSIRERILKQKTVLLSVKFNLKNTFIKLYFHHLFLVFCIGEFFLLVNFKRYFCPRTNKNMFRYLE